MCKPHFAPQTAAKCSAAQPLGASTERNLYADSRITKKHVHILLPGDICRWEIPAIWTHKVCSTKNMKTYIKGKDLPYFTVACMIPWIGCQCTATQVGRGKKHWRDSCYAGKQMNDCFLQVPKLVAQQLVLQQEGFFCGAIFDLFSSAKIYYTRQRVVLRVTPTQWYIRSLTGFFILVMMLGGELQRPIDTEHSYCGQSVNSIPLFPHPRPVNKNLKSSLFQQYFIFLAFNRQCTNLY